MEQNRIATIDQPHDALLVMLNISQISSEPTDTTYSGSNRRKVNMISDLRKVMTIPAKVR